MSANSNLIEKNKVRIIDGQSISIVAKPSLSNVQSSITCMGGYTLPHPSKKFG